MDNNSDFLHEMTRRNFLSKSSLGIGAAALASIITPEIFGAGNSIVSKGNIGMPHFVPKAKRVIFLFQGGGPSPVELFDHKPLLAKMHKQNLPESVMKGLSQRLTGLVSSRGSFPLVGSPYKFKKHGQSGASISELLPHTARIADELCFVKSMHTDSVNHDPAITFFQTGSQLPGRPSMGSWMSYGLGSENKNLPAFCVLLSRGTGNVGEQPFFSRTWSNGFLHSIHQGVQFRSGKDPVLYLNNPPGISANARRDMLDQLKSLNEIKLKSIPDPEIETRIAQYEMAYRMQTSVPETMDISNEPDSVYELYGPDSRKPGTYAANCILARRLAERNVRFIQLFHSGWDAHNNLPQQIENQCKDTDQASAALIIDLKRRGLLDDTLVIWGGEFGRTSFSQGNIEPNNYGRDHYAGCFTMWMAGGGVKPGISYGETDDFGYQILRNPVHVHDFQATILHLMGLDHEKLTFKSQGRRYRLTDVGGKVVNDILA